MRKCEISSLTDFSKENLELFGINLLNGIQPEITDNNNSEISDIFYNDTVDPLAYNVITDNFPENSVEIKSDECSIIYDLSKSTDIDRILISAVDSVTSEYSIYISENKAEIFSDNSFICDYTSTSLYTENSDNEITNQIFYFDGDFKSRYFAIKFNAANTENSTLKITHIGLYNNKIDNKLLFCKRTFGENLLTGLIPSVKGSYTADLSNMTDGICFDNATRTLINSDTEYIYTLNDALNIKNISVVADENMLQNAEIYISEQKEDIFAPENQVNYSQTSIPTNDNEAYACRYTLENDKESQYIGLKFNSKFGFIDQIIAQ